jgi:hypothetical protein
MDIAGICRFSLLGRGDWKVYQGKPTDQIEAIAQEQAKNLFAPERIEHRLATFEHITLASMRAQTDQNFHFIVLASEFMPEEYKDKLTSICADVPQVTLRFFPLIGAGAAQKSVFAEIGLPFSRTLQFRLDDDDAVSANYIEKMRIFCAPLAQSGLKFSASFDRVVFAQTADGTGFMRKLPFMSAGAALLHRQHSIFAFGHFALGKRFTSVSIPSCHSLCSKHETNDSGGRKRKPEKRPLGRDEMARYVAANFPFLDGVGLSLLGVGAQNAR